MTQDEFDNIEIAVWCNSGFAGEARKETVKLSEYTDLAAWQILGEKAKEEVIFNIASAWAHEFIEYGGEIVE